MKRALLLCLFVSACAPTMAGQLKGPDGGLVASPEARVKVKRGAAAAKLQQGGYTPILIKVHNESTVTKPLRITSPQAMPIFSRGKPGGIWVNTQGEKLPHWAPLDTHLTLMPEALVSHDVAQINHYMVRSAETYRLKRGTKSPVGLGNRYRA